MARDAAVETACPASDAVRFAGCRPAGFPVGQSSGGQGCPVCRCLRLDWEDPDPHARQDVDASSVTPACGEPAETKKARYVVALSRVLRSVRDMFPAVRPRTLCDHRHVRNWARGYVWTFAFTIKEFLQRSAD